MSFIQDAYADNDTIAVQGEPQALPAAPSDPSQPGFLNSGLVPMVLIFVVFYFLLIRPQEKKRKEQEAMVSGVKRGEEILTNSGIFGVVTRLNDNDNTVEVEIAKDINIKILKNSIADIVSRKKAAPAAKK